MGYKDSLEAAGAKVLDFEEFGSYQGDWVALVEFNGERGIVRGSYGSCSGCDSFLAQFGFRDEPFEQNGKYYFGSSWEDDEEHEISKEEYEIKKKEFQKELSDFGMHYLTPPLENIQTINAQIESLKKDDWFDGETKQVLEWCLTKLTN